MTAAAKSKKVKPEAKLHLLDGRPKGAGPHWGKIDFALKRHKSPHGQVTAVSMMKDEGPFVIEWVAHHLAIGFTDLVVYTNDCSDGTDKMLLRLEELGLCHHRANVIPEGIRPQPSALNHAQIEPVVQQSDWVMVFDADEFLSIKHGDGSLDGLLSAAVAQGANGVVVTWRIFGSAGVVNWSRAPVSEQYLMAAPETWNKGWGVKTLFKFDPDKWNLGIHRPKMKAKWIETEFPDQVKWLNGSGNEMEDYFKFRGWRSITRTVGYEWAQLNHYAVKSVDSYAVRKMRGNVNNKADKYNSDYWSLQDRNEVLCDTMLRYTQARNQIIDALLADPVLKDLHFSALARTEARLDELRKTGAYRALLDDLALASAVPITQIVAKPPQPRDREKIAALMSDVEKKRGAKAREDRKDGPQSAPANQVPMGSYVANAVELPQTAVVEFYPNHTLKLPLDPRVFAAHVLPSIQAGKFERGLARRMPVVLAQAANVLEVGSAVGFLAGHCANVRPDLSITMYEDSLAFLTMMASIFAISERSFTKSLRLANSSADTPFLQSVLTLVRAERPTALLLADRRVGPEVLGRILENIRDHKPLQLFIYGQMLEKWHPQIDEICQICRKEGYVPDYGFDPNICRGFRLDARP